MEGKLDRRALAAGAIAAALLAVAIYLGSGRMRHFDPALIPYTSASVFACFGIVYRYAVWLGKPPTQLYWRRGWQLFTRPTRLLGNAVRLVGLLWTNIVAQTFIERRSPLRWASHVLISWGCIVAAFVTFPLVFGWVHFEADPHDPMAYKAFVFGMQAGAFPATSAVGWLTFHVLDFCALAVIAGVVLAFQRRMRDPGALVVQQFGTDLLPLVLLLSISLTGLMLTVSSLWLRGHSYSFIALLHAFTVIVTLLYLPFGKFFHVFQRPAQLGVKYYKREGEETEQARCQGCGEPYASQMHVRDLERTLDRLGLDQRYPSGVHYQQVCPTCRRRLLALNQREAIGGQGFL